MVQSWASFHNHTLLSFHNMDNCNHNKAMLDYMSCILCIPQNPLSCYNIEKIIDKCPVEKSEN